jgi:hypothetical protein
MVPITYSLKTNLNKSDNYYKDIKSYTNEILKEFERFNTSLIPDLILYNHQNDSKVRKYEEYIFELLMIGMFWKVYSKKAVSLDQKPQILLKNLADLRNINESAKEKIDIIRGILMTHFLLPNNEPIEGYPELTLNNFNKLLKYLQATGDFTQEVNRLNYWKEFFTTKTVPEISEYLKNAFEFASFFETRSQKVLGKYTSNIAKYLEEKHEEHLWKEDVIFCNRTEIEYHLNMVGAEIMNRIFEKDFNERSRKALLLPGCMRFHPETCQAIDTNLGLKCIKCSKMCNVCELKFIGDEYGFEVYIVSHESSAFSKSTQKDREELGIIGVACVSNLIAGGWKSESLDIPAQCVLLNSASCKNHWHKVGLPTDININQLMKLFGINKNLKGNKPQISSCIKSY